MSVYQYSDELENILMQLRIQDHDRADELIDIIVKAARFDELTKIGKLMNGSRKTLIDHYEERYKYLKENK